ncbi:MAG: thioesterase family protein [Hyphomicrobiaceae bacterium]|nr:thioesterase family protein [Hyphomicrobiaceae bacterium]
MPAPAYFETEKQIRFHHCDPAGIVFYPQFFVLFHELLEDWFDHGLKLHYASLIAKERRGLPTAHIECDFKVPSKIGDIVRMRLQVLRLGTSSITIAVSLHAGEEVRLTAKQVLVLISLDDGRALPLPEDLRRRMAAFMA